MTTLVVLLPISLILSINYLFPQLLSYSDLSLLNFIKIIGTTIPIYLNMMLILICSTEFNLKEIFHFNKEDLLINLIYLSMLIANFFMNWGIKHNKIYLILTIVCIYILIAGFNFLKENVRKRANT